ncbi:MAG: sulfotransferase family protein [Mariniblastus sp.]
MRLGDYLRLMRENRFKIHPFKYPMFALGGGCAVMNSILAQVQDVTHGSVIESAQLKDPPVFIIGHWRSGTTLMHELMSLDSRLAFPTNFDAFIPNHFLASRFFFYPFLKLLMPRQRPMDNMSMGVGSPQEDDFALCAYGAPTPYRRIAFPNQPNREHLNLKLSDADHEVQERLHGAMDYFLKALTVRYDSQLVLKSPPHTGRLSQLADWFPGAKFVHMARHPHKLVPSTMRLWKLLDSLQGFQIPRYDDTWLKNYIFECKDLMYSAYFNQRDSIPKNQLVEVNFENLTSQPIVEMERVYDQLEMDGFAELEPSLVEYFERKKHHKKNPFTLESSLELEIDNNWHRYMDEFGYSDPSESATD